ELLMIPLTVLYYFLYFLCFSVTYSLTVEAGITTTSSYESIFILFMPVTIRLRAKFLEGVDQEATKPILPDSEGPAKATVVFR
ncbi:MAG: hypothetical protein ACK53Y_24825, partial [bacterium]